MTNDEAVVAARQLITERSESSVNVTRPRIYALIPTALRKLRQWLIKPENQHDRILLKKTITANFSSGTFDLANSINGTTNSIDFRDIRNTTLYYGSPLKPLKWVASRAQLNAPRQLDSDYIAVFLDGTVLRTRNTDGSLTTFTGNVSFEAVDYPNTVAEIPEPLEEQLVEMLASLVLRVEA